MQSDVRLHEVEWRSSTSCRCVFFFCWTSIQINGRTDVFTAVPDVVWISTEWKGWGAVLVLHVSFSPEPQITEPAPGGAAAAPAPAPPEGGVTHTGRTRTAVLHLVHTAFHFFMSVSEIWRLYGSDFTCFLMRINARPDVRNAPHEEWSRLSIRIEKQQPVDQLRTEQPAGGLFK